MSVVELTAQEKEQRLRLHLAEWQRARYDAEINARVAHAIDDEQMAAAAAQQLARALMAIDVIEKILAEVQQIDSA